MRMGLKTPHIPTNRKWYLCPVCNKKLLVFDNTAKSKGVFMRCKKCGSEVEIKI